MAPDCCERFCGELNPCQDWYTILDGGQVLDVEKTFAYLTRVSLGFKVVSHLLFNFVFVYTLWIDDHRGIYFGKLTYWALTLCVVYSWMSLANTALGVTQPKRCADNVQFRVGVQWFLFHAAAHLSLLVTFLWWVVEFESGETTFNFKNLSTHGGTCLVLLFEGFVVNRIPIRWFFWWGAVLPINLAYFGWTVLHAKSDIGNPSRNDSDLLYDTIDWEDDAWGALQTFLVSILLVGPFLQTLLYAMSLHGWPVCCGKLIRRYVADSKSSRDIDV